MTSAFAALDAMLSGAVDARLGETLVFKPVVAKDNWGNPKDDVSRAEITVTGILLDGSPDIQFLDGDRRISQFNARSIVCDAWVTFDRNAFPPDNMPRKGDTIASDFPSPRSFEIVDVLSSSFSRIACPLTRLPS